MHPDPRFTTDRLSTALARHLVGYAGHPGHFSGDVLSGPNDTIVIIDVPGVVDLKVETENYRLRITGQRRPARPDGYEIQVANRHERRVDYLVEIDHDIHDFSQITASVKDGILTISIAKLVAAQKREIKVESR